MTMFSLSTLVSLLPRIRPGSSSAAPTGVRHQGLAGLERRADHRLDQLERSRAATDFRVAQRPEEFFGAFRLVYEAYVRSGLAVPNAYEMRVTPFHLLPTTQVFAAMTRNRVDGTVTLVQDGELGLPMEAIYDREVSRRRAEGLRLAEVSCLADRHQDLRRSLPAVIRLMSLMAQYAVRCGVDQLVIAVHPRHAPFYRRFTAFVPFGGRRTYGAVCDKPAVALALDLNRAPVDHARLYKRFLGNPFPERAFQHQPMSEALRSELELVVDASYGMHSADRALELAAC